MDRGRYTTFDAPEAVLQTEPASVNNRGEIVGHYMDAAGIRHGFVRDRHGRFTTINVPGAKTGTVPLRINDRGQLVGYDENTAATASPQPAGTPPMSRMF